MTEDLKNLKGSREFTTEKYKELARIYKTLEVLQNLYNDCHSQLSWPITMIANILYNVLAAYLCIKCHESLDAIGLGMFSYCVVAQSCLSLCLYPIQAKNLESSKDLIRSWRTQTDFNWDVRSQRELGALRPISIQIWNFFTIEKVTSITVIYVVSSTTFNCLLVF